MKMRILVIGLGSMGKRRICLLKDISKKLEIVGVDTNEYRRKTVEEKFCIHTCSSLEKALKSNYDCAVICTPPLTHHDLIEQLLPLNIFIFTELNLVQDGYEQFIQHENYEKLFLSSTLLYRKDIEYICNSVKDKRVVYSYHVGQYLPDWHPWENYTNFFVADKRTNGCREIMAIDFPWIIEAFGKIVDITVKKNKISNLEISYFDNYLILLEHENGSKGSVIVDIVSRKAMRKLEVFNENIHLFWEGTPQSLREYNLNTQTIDVINSYSEINKNSNYSENIIENAYKDELIAFLAMADKNQFSDIKYDLKKDKEILEIIDKIESINGYSDICQSER